MSDLESKLGKRKTTCRFITRLQMEKQIKGYFSLFRFWRAHSSTKRAGYKAIFCFFFHCFVQIQAASGQIHKAHDKEKRNKRFLLLMLKVTINILVRRSIYTFTSKFTMRNSDKERLSIWIFPVRGWKIPILRTTDRNRKKYHLF